MAIDPRIRDSAGQFSSKGALTPRSLRKAWRIPISSFLMNRSTQFNAGPLLQFDAVPSSLTTDKIDDVNAIIRGVSVITSGLVARGHDLEVDDITLAQMQQCAESKGQVPVKVDHKSGAAAVCGFLTNFRREEGKLKADWYLLETHPQKAQILEVARRMPRGVGLSASFLSPEKPEKAKSGRMAARCHDLISVDYVTLPAANPDGMFSAKVDSSPTAMNPELTAALQKIVTDALAPITSKLEALEASQKSLTDQINPSADELTLEQAVQMSPEELAKHGLTQADVDAAVEAALASTEGGEGGEGGEGTQGDGSAELVGATSAAAPAAAAPAAPAAAGAATGLSALEAKVVELTAKINELTGQRQVDAEADLVESLERNFAALAEENTRLREALKTGTQASTPGVDRNGVRFFSAKKNEGEFEKLVQFEIENNKLTKAKAFQAVISANPEAYKDFRVRSGIEKAE